ncbi:MAG: 5' nucleotidase, NT5C type [Candidatus Methylomirabilales bacterium]
MRIGLDLDDVLTESLPRFIEAFERRFGIPIRLEEAAWDLLAKNPEISPEAYKTFLKELDRQGFFEKGVLDPEAKAAVERLHAFGHRLYIVTGRLPVNERVTLHWLEEKGLLRYFDAVLHKEGDHVLEYKKRAASQLGLHVFIEDELPVALALASTSRQPSDFTRLGAPRRGRSLSVLLFDRPWNQGPLPPGIRRIHSWPEALEAIAQYGKFIVRP